MSFSLLQTKAVATGSGVAPPRPEVAVRARKVLPSTFPKKVAAMNKTYDDVAKIIQTANSTIVDVVRSVEENFGALVTALGAAKDLADELKPILGKKLTDWVHAFADTMQGYAGALNSQESELDAQTQKSLYAVLEDFIMLREAVVFSYNKAGAKVDELSDKCIEAAKEDAATKLQRHRGEEDANESQAWGPLGWIFGGGHKSPCQVCHKVVRKANDTANEVAVKLVELNNTIDVLFSEAEQEILAGIAKVNFTYIGSMEQAADFMSDKIKGKIDKAVKVVLNLAASVASKLSSSANDLYKQVDGARADMLPLYEASDMLLAAAEPCCGEEEKL